MVLLFAAADMDPGTWTAWFPLNFILLVVVVVGLFLFFLCILTLGIDQKTMNLRWCCGSYLFSKLFLFLEYWLSFCFTLAA